MAEYNFILHYDLPSGDDDPEEYMDALSAAGCSDASVGVSRPGAIALDFARESDCAYLALTKAAAEVQGAIAGARLTEVSAAPLNQ